MKREEIVNLTLPQFHAELGKLGLPLDTDRAACIDALASYYEGSHPAKEDSSKEDDHATQPVSAGFSCEKDRVLPGTPESIELALKLLTGKLEQQQLVIDRLINQIPSASQSCVSNVVPNLTYSTSSISHPSVLSDYSTHFAPSPDRVPVYVPGGQPAFFPAGGSTSTPSFQGPFVSAGGLPSFPSMFQTSSVLSTIPTAQAISLLASQIPPFNGLEEDNVDVWIKKVEYVACAHVVNDSVKLLAAVSKLGKHARDWFDMDTNMVPGSWDSFKLGVTRRFRRRVLFNVALQKAGDHRWNLSKESFQEYASAKLKLLHSLHLPDDACINLLVSGIDNFSIRSTAASLNVGTIDEFLDRMHQITTACSASSRRSSPPSMKKDKNKDSKEAKDSKERSSLSQKGSSSQKDIVCAYCKLRGHLKADCLKLKRKEQSLSSGSTTSSASSTVAAAEGANQSSTSKEDQPIVGCVGTESLRRIQISDSTIEINSINGRECSLLALVDTGSPVSFIQDSACKIFFRQNAEFDKSDLSCCARLGHGFRDSPM